MYVPICSCHVVCWEGNSTLSERSEKPCVPEPFVFCSPMCFQCCGQVNGFLHFAGLVVVVGKAVVVAGSVVVVVGEAVVVAGLVVVPAPQPV